jgi:transcriptional regulator
MYVNAHFKVHPATALAFAAARGFGLVIAADGGKPVASPLPFLLIEKDGQTPKLQFHVARANALAQIAEKGGNWLVAVQGHDAYLSPDWYAVPEQVPTWLYESVHLSGPVSVVPAEHTLHHVEQLSNHFEATLAPKPIWKMSKTPEKKLQMMSKAIVAIEMLVETVEGNFKFNQHKTDADHVAIVNALSQQPDPSAQAISARMAAMRPQLAYGPLADTPAALGPVPGPVPDLVPAAQ